MRPNTFNRGSALVISIILLGVLFVLAVPLLASIMLQEQKTTTLSYEQQVQNHSVGLRNFTFEHLSRTETEAEWKQSRPPFDTPYYDSIQELTLSPQIVERFMDTKARSGGIRVEDEQGKLNLRTAPESVVSRLQSLLGPNDKQNLYFTRHSLRRSKWIHPVEVRAIQPKEGVVYISDPSYYSVGSRVRLVTDNQVVTGKVVKNEVNKLIVMWDWEISKLSEDENTAVLWKRRRHPVNINTARKKVLVALFTGLNTGNALNQKKETISESTAEKLAEFLVQKPVQNHFHFHSRLQKAVKKKIVSAQQARRIFYNGLSPNQMRLVDTGTMPLCYRTRDVFTTRIGVSVQNPAGKQESSTTELSTVSISRPGTRTRIQNSQYELMEPFFRFRSPEYENVRFDPVSFSNLYMNDEKDLRTDGPFQNIFRRGLEQGRVQPAPLEDNRGERIEYSRSFPDNENGKRLEGDGLKNELFISDPKKTAGQFDINGGGIEFWIRFPTVPSEAVLFQAGEKQHQNHLHLYYENGSLVLEAADATLESKRTRVSASWNPEKNRWYHIGAYWKGTKFGLLGLMIDGHGVGKTKMINDENENLLLTLNQKLREKGKTSRISLTNAENLPEKGAIELGGEVIEYDGRSGKTINNVKRASRGTGRQNHPPESRGTPFGYESTIESEEISELNVKWEGISSARATLADSFGTKTSAETSLKITTETTMIPANFTEDSSASDFPQPGIIKLGKELIMYESVGPSGFQNCNRGVLNTKDKEHKKGETIQFFAFPVRNSSGWENNRTYPVQIKDEWLFPVETHQVAGQKFMGGKMIDRPVPFKRGVLNTKTQEHQENDLVLPTFITDSRDLASKLKTTEESVTVVIEEEGQQKLKEATVNIGRPCKWKRYYKKNCSIAAFQTDFLDEDIPANGRNRILKYPSNELISYPFRGGTEHLGIPDPDVDEGTRKPLEAYIDELRFFETPKGTFRLTESVGTTDNKLTVNRSLQKPGGGLIKVGDEWIGYPEEEQIDSKTSERRLPSVQRGYLESKKTIHNQGDRVFHFPFMPVTSLSKSIDETSEKIPLKSLYGFPSNGFVRVDGELIGYHRERKSTLIMPKTSSMENGMFRGSFGTIPEPHSKDTMVFAPPIRYPDWSSSHPGFHPAENPLLFADNQPGAFWKRVAWRFESVPYEDLLYRIRVRSSNEDQWRSFKMLSSTAEGNEDLNLRSDHLQVQILFDYADGAYNATQWRSANDWKETAAFDRLKLSLRKPTIIFRHRKIR